MRLLLLPILLLSSLFVFAQNIDTKPIREAEAKAAKNLLLGSRNMNTNNYDLKYHRLELNVDPTQAFISGKVTSHFKAKEPMNTIVFELVNNMIVSEVKQRGVALPFTQNSDDEVVITLPQTQQTGILDSLSISYSGNPLSSGFGSFEVNTHNNEPILWTLSEPFGAKAWWPCKQDLIDKVDVVDFYITTPRYSPSNQEYVAVANGLELGQSIQGNSKTTHYRHGHPIPAYLIGIAVTNYSVYSHTVANNGNPFEIINYVYPEFLSYAQQRTPVTVDIMNLYADLFEPYPYADEKYGHAQMGWGGGMEHTTVSFMGSLERGLIAHELGHQWFGDKVTCGSWQDVWLNEGFATYMEGMVVENLDGNTDFKYWKKDQVDYITSYPGGSVYIPAQDTININRIFDGRLSYDKASMVLHMLRKRLGDADFFQGATSYLNDPALSFGYAKTEDLKRNMEAVSGKNLTKFFNDWVYGQGYPSYTVKWNQQNSSSINISISQTQSLQSAPFFEAPVPLRLKGSQGETLDIILENTSNNQTFHPSVNFMVQSIVFDPEYDLISKGNQVYLGTPEMEIKKQIEIYPNPSSGQINISHADGIEIEQINIFNTLGQILYSHSFTETLDISKLSSGILFVELRAKSGVVTKTIIKE